MQGGILGGYTTCQDMPVAQKRILREHLVAPHEYADAKVKMPIVQVEVIHVSVPVV